MRRSHAVWVAVLVASTTSCAMHDANRKEPQMLQYSTGQRSRPLPFSDAVRVGNLLFVSGQLGVDKDMKLVPGGIRPETKAVMDNIKRVVEANGSSMDRVVKCTCMLADMSEWQKMNEVYVTYFPKDRLPARSAFAASALALGGRVEIECIAAVGE
jgi:reactive intermediate/imine deaminase